MFWGVGGLGVGDDVGADEFEHFEEVGLGGVEGGGVVADVLGAVENFECQTVEELALGEQSTYGLKTPTGT